jgi:hypothetical protein
MKKILMSKKIKRNIFCLGVVILLLICIYCCTHKSDSHSARILFDFEKDEELNLFYWKCKTLFSLSEEYARHGNRSLRVEFYPTRQVGFSTDRVYHEWNQLNALQFAVFNPTKKRVTVFLQISDDSTRGDPSKAYIKMLNIASGENVIIVPISELRDSFSRKLNTRNIKGFYIFIRKISVRTILYFDYFQLI